MAVNKRGLGSKAVEAKGNHRIPRNVSDGPNLQGRGGFYLYLKDEAVVEVINRRFKPSFGSR